MKCYNHPSTDGVAVCKSCGRAICHDCCAEVETSCACKGRCEAEVERSNVRLKRGQVSGKKIGYIRRKTGTCFLTLGVLMACAGVSLQLLDIESAGPLTVFLGVVFAVSGMIFMMSGGKQLSRPKQFTNVEK